MNDSRANPNARQDIFQDFDVVYFVTDVASFIDDDAWIDQFGRRIILQRPETMGDPPQTTVVFPTSCVCRRQPRVGNSDVILWRVGELFEMNIAYNVPDYAPGLLLFGSDGGGEAFAFDTRTAAIVIVSVPFVGMELKAARIVASNFNAFLQLLSK